MSDWFYRSKGRTCGPVSREELEFLAASGHIGHATEVRCGHDSKWNPLKPKPASLTTDRNTGDRLSGIRKSGSNVEYNSNTLARPIAAGSIIATKEDAYRIQVAVGIALGVLLLLVLLFMFWNTVQNGGSSTGSNGSGVVANDEAHESATSSQPGDVGSDESDTTVRNDVPTSGNDNTNSPETRSGTGNKAPPSGSGDPASKRMTAPSEEDIDFRKRLQREGAQSGVTQISLAWNDYNDLDLYVRCPSGELIGCTMLRSRCGGELDVDMNVEPSSSQPVENIVWVTDAPTGLYQVYVHFNEHHSRRQTQSRSNFQVRVMTNGKARNYSSELALGDPLFEVTSFTLNETD